MKVNIIISLFSLLILNMLFLTNLHAETLKVNLTIKGSVTKTKDENNEPYYCIKNGKKILTCLTNSKNMESPQLDVFKCLDNALKNKTKAEISGLVNSDYQTMGIIWVNKSVTCKTK